jgi:hypothetical protein
MKVWDTLCQTLFISEFVAVYVVIEAHTGNFDDIRLSLLS